MELNDLKKPFPENEVQWRIQASGLKKDGSPWARAIAYIDSRSVQNRLDEVIGSANWSDSYVTIEGGFICTLSIKCGEWVSKSDGAEATDIEGLKGGISDAFKRAAVKWGIGRYLYDMEPVFVEFVQTGGQSVKIKDNYYQWVMPQKRTSVGTVAEPAQVYNPSGMVGAITESQYRFIMREKSILLEDEWNAIKTQWKVTDPSKLSKQQASEVIGRIKEVLEGREKSRKQAQMKTGTDDLPF